MVSDGYKESEPTQKTQPRTDAEPAHIPIPTRERVIADLMKIAPPVEQDDEPENRANSGD